MAWYRCGGGAGLPASLKTGMNNVFNKKFGTVSQDYPPNGWPDDVNLLGLLEEKTQASASVCAFSDGADDVPTSSVKVTIPPTLSGVSALNEKQTGRNILDFTVRSQYGITTTKGTDGGVIISGTASGNVFVIDFVAMDLEAGKYNILVSGMSTGMTASWTKNGAYGGALNEGANVITLSAKTTIGGYVRVTSGSSYPDPVTVYVQLTIGQDSEAFEKYDPTTYTASLGRTIYGGQADIVNGEGQETYGEPWTWTAGMSGVSVNNNGVCYINKSDVVTVNASNQTTLVGCVCADSNFPSRTWAGLQNSNTNGCACVYGNGIAIRIAGYTTKEEYEAYLTNNPLTFVYMLKTPTDFTFTGQEIPTRLGYNAFWSESGDTEVTYRSSDTITPIQPTLISKSITENGTYNASDDSADGYSSVTVNVSGGSCERLLYLHCVNNDQIEIPAASSITQGAKYSQYVSYDSTTKKFTVLQDFTAIIIAWVYTYQTYESSRSDGAIYINNSQVAQYEASGTAAGSTGGVYLARNFKQNDTFNVYTPTRDGYPQQNLKIYLLAAVPDNIYTFTDENA